MPSSLSNDFWQKITPAVPIGKQQAYITLPSFSSAFTWRGTSTIVAQYSYATTNNFTFINLPAKPSDANFTLCVKYRIGNTVTRYRLWATTGDAVYYPLYTGQAIKKNFTLEIWSTANNTPVVLSTAVNFTLSILKAKVNLDDADSYLNVANGSLVDQAGLKNTNSLVDIATALPLTVLGGDMYLEGYWTANDLATGLVSSWSPNRSELPVDDQIVLTGAGGTRPTCVDGEYLTNGKAVSFPDATKILSGSSPIGGSQFSYAFLVFKQTTWVDDARIFTTEGVNWCNFYQQTLTPSNAFGIVNGSGVSPQGFTLDTWYIVHLFNGGPDENYKLDMFKRVLKTGVESDYQSTATTFTPAEMGAVKLGHATASAVFKIAAFGIYVGVDLTVTNTFPYSQLLIIDTFLKQQYGGITLPMTFSTTQHGITN